VKEFLKSTNISQSYERISGGTVARFYGSARCIVISYYLKVLQRILLQRTYFLAKFVDACMNQGTETLNVL